MGQSEPCECRNKTRVKVLVHFKDLQGGQSNGEKYRGMLEEYDQQSTERFYKAMTMNAFGALNKTENHLRQREEWFYGEF